jgi:hypothetical protein
MIAIFGNRLPERRFDCQAISFPPPTDLVSRPRRSARSANLDHIAFTAAAL